MLLLNNPEKLNNNNNKNPIDIEICIPLKENKK